LSQPALKRGLAAALLITLSSCTSLPDKADRPDAAPLLRQIAATVSGDFAATPAEQQNAMILLTVAAEPLTASSDRLALALTQQASDTSLRRFRLTLFESPTAEARLAGILAPLAPNGGVISECPMRVRMNSNGLSAATDAASCQFGSGAERVGLAKEFLFTGDQIRVADRIQRPAQNNTGDQTISELRFFRLSQYRGWVGVSEAGEWRIARNVQIDTAQGFIEPVDAAGMALGVTVELEHALMPGSDGDSILRLSVVDSQSGTTLARSWTQAGAERLGLATDSVQIGLERDSIP